MASHGAVVVGAGLAEGDVLAHPPRPLGEFLRHQTGQAPDRGRVGVGEVGSVPGDPAFVTEVDPGDQSRQGGLPGAVRSDDCEDLASLQGEETPSTAGLSLPGYW